MLPDLLTSSSIALPQSLPWYLKDLNQSCDDIFCSEGEGGDEDEAEIGEEYTRYSGPLYFEVVPPAKTEQGAEVKNQEHIGGNNISLLLVSHQPVMEDNNLALGGKSWCYGISCVIAIVVMVINIPRILLGLRLAINYTPQRRKKSTSKTYKLEWNKKEAFHSPKMSASQKRRKRRRQTNGDERSMSNSVYRSHSTNDTQEASEGENGSLGTLMQTTTVLSIEQESSTGNKRQEKDVATDIIMSNRDTWKHSPSSSSSSSSQIIDGSTKYLALTNSSDSRPVVVCNDVATPCCLNYTEQVQMIAAVLSVTGLDNNTSLTLANQTILRRLETQFMLQQQDQQKQKQEQTAEVGPSALGLHHFKFCFVTSILVRASIQLHRYLVNNHYSSNILSAIYDYSFKGKNTKMTTSSYITAFLTHMCGCGRQGEPDVIMDSDLTRQAEPYVYNILSYYYYYTAKAPSIVTTLLQMQCWAFCFIPWLISGIALYLLHQLLDIFHSPKQLHHLINLTAFLTVFSFQDVALRLTILHTLLLLGTNVLVYVLQRMFYNRKSQIMIIKSAAVVSFSTSFLLGFAVN